MSASRRQIFRTQPVVRVKTGCLTCRRRKKKCDETRPICRGCSRNDLSCHWQEIISKGPQNDFERIVDLDSTEAPQEHTLMYQAHGDEVALNDSECVARPISLQNSDADLDGADFYNIEADVNITSLEQRNMVWDSSASDHNFRAEEAIQHFRREITPMHTAGNSPTIMVPSLLPNSNTFSIELLQYYLSRTANSMSNGSTELNPFIVQLVPLAFSNDLILQSLLTQSAAHRATSNDIQHSIVATKHYTNCLRLFRQNLTKHVEGMDQSTLALAMGALIMCFTETARGDVNGAVFDHLAAANILLAALFNAKQGHVPEDMYGFLIEYYTYAATLSMISIDPGYATQELLSPEFELAAQRLVAAGYIGHLCGCWLELLLLIPRIFHLGRRAKSENEDEHSHFPSADDILNFSSLQAQISLFSVPIAVDSEVAMAGAIFQKAMLLYLYTSLEDLNSNENGAFQNLLQSTIIEAMSLLDSLSPTARINTSLCWPIAVIGAMLNEDILQSTLRSRLQIMSQCIGLGNIQATLDLLEHMWQLPRGKSSPWTICHVMQTHQIWISFA